MAGQKNGFTYFRDLTNLPSTSDLTTGHKALFTLNDGVFVMDAAGEVVRLDDYQLIQDVSGALSESISAHSAVVLRGTFDLNTNDYVYTVPHSSVNISNTTPLVTLTSPSNSSVLYVTAVRNRTNISFDVVLSDVPNDPGYSINWLIIGDAVLSGGSGSSSSVSASPDILGSGTVLISAQQSIIPTISGAFNLGSANFPWKDLYLSGNTLYLAGVAVRTLEGQLTVDGQYVATTATVSASDLSIYATKTFVSSVEDSLLTLTYAASANALNQANVLRSAGDANLQSQLTSVQSISGNWATSATVDATANSLLTSISNEATTRSNADTNLQSQLTSVQSISGNWATSATVDALDSSLKNNGRITYIIQTGSFVDPGGSDGDIVYVV